MALTIAESFLHKTGRGRLFAGLGFVLTLYFLIHAVIGERGWLAHRTLTAQIAEAEATLAELKARQELMRADLSGLDPKHIDPDRLEEQAYKTLGFAAPQDEIVITGVAPASASSGHSDH